jgi:heme oxygenase
MMVAAYSARSTMLERLDRETSSLHAVAETDRMRLLADPSPAGYRRFLATVYRFRYAVESALVLVDDLPIAFVYAGLESGRLGDSLMNLGLDAHVRTVLARACAVPKRFTDAVDALGWLYVVDRAFLKTRSTRRGELGRLLDTVAGARDAASEIVVHAREAFERQHQWFVDAQAPASIEVS